MILTSFFNLWSLSWPAGLTMLGLGLGFAIILLIASEKLKVVIDPKIDLIHKTLPGLNCGVCGFPGCAGYAKAVLENPQLLGKCVPGGGSTAEKIAEILNVEISQAGAPKRPLIHCRANHADKTFYGIYRGIQTCTAANALANVQACKFGCLGFGDCTKVCKFAAITVIDGLATVDYRKCTGCGACAKACPRNLIELVPFNCDSIPAVACSNRETGKVTRAMCKVGCIACSLCAKQTDLFAVKDNLARLDYARYQPSPQTQTAYNKCPTAVIVYRGKDAVPPRIISPRTPEPANA